MEQATKRARVSSPQSEQALYSSSAFVLPQDLFIFILAYFPLRERLRRVSRVCKTWRHAVLISITTAPVVALQNWSKMLSLLPAITKLDLSGAPLPLPALTTSIRDLTVPYVREERPKNINLALPAQPKYFTELLKQPLPLRAIRIAPDFQVDTLRLLLNSYSSSLQSLAVEISMPVHDQLLASVHLPHLESLSCRSVRPTRFPSVGPHFSSKLTSLHLYNIIDIGATDLKRLTELRLLVPPDHAAAAFLVQVAPQLSKLKLTVADTTVIPTSVLPYITSLELTESDETAEQLQAVLAACTKLLRFIPSTDNDPVTFGHLVSSLSSACGEKMRTELSAHNKVWSNLKTDEESINVPSFTNMTALSFPALRLLDWKFYNVIKPLQIVSSLAFMVEAAPNVRVVRVKLPASAQEAVFDALREMIAAAERRGLRELSLEFAKDMVPLSDLVAHGLVDEGGENEREMFARLEKQKNALICDSQETGCKVKIFFRGNSSGSA